MCSNSFSEHLLSLSLCCCCTFYNGRNCSHLGVHFKNKCRLTLNMHMYLLFQKQAGWISFTKIAFKFPSHLLMSSKVWFDSHIIPPFVWCQLKLELSLCRDSHSVPFIPCTQSVEVWPKACCGTHMSMFLSQVWNSDTQCQVARCRSCANPEVGGHFLTTIF